MKGPVPRRQRTAQRRWRQFMGSKGMDRLSDVHRRTEEPSSDDAAIHTVFSPTLLLKGLQVQ